MNTVAHRCRGAGLSWAVWRTADQRFAVQIPDNAQGDWSTTGTAVDPAFRIGCVRAWTSNPAPTTTSAMSYRSENTRAIDVDHAGRIGSMPDTSWVLRLDGPLSVALSSTGPCHGEPTSPLSRISNGSWSAGTATALAAVERRNPRSRLDLVPWRYGITWSMVVHCGELPGGDPDPGPIRSSRRRRILETSPGFEDLGGRQWTLEATSRQAKCLGGCPSMEVPWQVVTVSRPVGGILSTP